MHLQSLKPAAILAALFLFCFLMQVVVAWFSPAAALHVPSGLAGALRTTSQQALEHWPSEIFRLAWQAAALSVLFFLGSSRSRPSDDR